METIRSILLSAIISMIMALGIFMFLNGMYLIPGILWLTGGMIVFFIGVGILRAAAG
jgi:hypothetical protein